MSFQNRIIIRTPFTRTFITHPIMQRWVVSVGGGAGVPNLMTQWGRTFTLVRVTNMAENITFQQPTKNELARLLNLTLMQLLIYEPEGFAGGRAHCWCHHSTGYQVSSHVRSSVIAGVTTQICRCCCTHYRKTFNFLLII